MDSKIKTQAEIDYSRYMHDEISVYDLDLTCFADKKMIDGIIKKEQKRVNQANKKYLSTDEKVEISITLQKIISYITQMAENAKNLSNEENTELDF